MSNVATIPASASANNNTPEAIQIPATINWATMTGGEIYDKLHEKGGKRGPWLILFSNKESKRATFRQMLGPSSLQTRPPRENFSMK